MDVAEIMTANPGFVLPETSIQEALGKLIELDVRHLPVVQDGKLVGIVSDRDFRDYSLPASEEFYEPSNSRARLDKPVSTIMSTGVYTISPTATISEVIDLMIDDKFTAIPVVESPEETLVGIVSYVDVLKVLKNSWTDD